jgi:oligoribonuclease
VVVNDIEFLWIDVETSGLDPYTCDLLEVAAVVTKADLVPSASMHCILHAPVSARENVDPVVLRMHTENGLWDACAASTATLEDATRALRELIAVHCEGRPTLAGSSVHFDADWLAAKMPALTSRLHYRRFDSRTLSSALEMWCDYPVTPLLETHRAMDDIQHVLSQMRKVRSLFQMPDRELLDDAAAALADDVSGKVAVMIPCNRKWKR